MILLGRTSINLGENVDLRAHPVLCRMAPVEALGACQAVGKGVRKKKR